MTIPTPTVAKTMEGEQAREKLQKAINLLTCIANQVGSHTLIERDRSRLVRELWLMMPDAEKMLTELAEDDIPF